MFSKDIVDDIFSQLKAEWGYVSRQEWSAMLKDAHLGIARAEAGVPLGNIDGRVRAIIEKRMEPGTFTAEDLSRMGRPAPAPEEGRRSGDP
jgi:hypothetical protein